MVTPKILTDFNHRQFGSHSGKDFPNNYEVKEKDFVINNYPITNRTQDGINCFVALKDQKYWHIKKVSASYGTGWLSIFIYNDEMYDAFAFPIDSRMTAEDIEGATHIFPNSDNTGWLFAHAHENDHHERVILLEAIMHTLFEDLVHSKLESALKAVIGHNNPSPQAGTALLYNYNSQFGTLSNYSNLVAFRQECVKWCSETEKLLHLGQHVQEDDHYLQHQLVRAINQAKLIWNADTGKKRNLATIINEVDAIIARVETDHEIDTRWVKAAKAAAAEAARKAAEAAANSGSEGDDNNG